MNILINIKDISTKMIVFIKLLDKTKYELEIDEKRTILHLKNMIYDKLNIHILKQRLHRLKRKMRQKFIKNINKTVSFHYSDVKAPRRALNYLTISTFYRRNG